MYTVQLHCATVLYLQFMQILEEFLSNDTALTTLDLSMNTVGKHGARFIAAGLTKNTRLRTLRLDHNSIRSAGAHFLASVLKRADCKLEELSLFCNVSLICIASTAWQVMSLCVCVYFLIQLFFTFSPRILLLCIVYSLVNVYLTLFLVH